MTTLSGRAEFFEVGGTRYELDVQCKAQTRRGTRCQLPLWGGQVWMYDQEPHPEEPDQQLWFFSPKDIAIALGGLCSIHRKGLARVLPIAAAHEIRRARAQRYDRFGIGAAQ